MKIEEMLKLPGLEQVFIKENDNNYVQVLRSLDDFYININEKISGPFNGYVEMLEFMTDRFIEIYEKSEILIDQLEYVFKEACKN